MKLELAITALLILAVIPSAYCLGEGTPYVPTEEGVYYRVDVFDMEKWEFKPEDFWSLTDPDPYIIKAMQHPSVYVLTDINDTSNPDRKSFLFKTYYDHDGNSFFTYNGSYYDCNIHYVWYDKGGSAGGYPYLSDNFHKAVLLDEDPEEYVEIADPNPYLKACFEHPEVWVWFDRYYFRDHPEETEPKELWNLNLSYQGKYYHFARNRPRHGIWLPLEEFVRARELRRKFVVGVAVSAAVVAAAFIVYRKRKNQATPGEH